MDAASDAGGLDAARVDSGEDAGDECADAREGAACAAEGVVCGGPCTDECSFCNVLRCYSGRWVRFEVFPATCFSCGPMLQCVSGESYCRITTPGVEGADTIYECVAPPTDCEGMLSCDCLVRAGVFGDCRQEGAGEVIVELFAP